MGIAENLKRVQDHVADACARSGRDPASVEIMLVSKTHPVETVMEAYALGHRLFGENRVQEALEKIPRCPDDIRWHMIGHLQTNKVSKALQHFHAIESVDRLHLAQVINQKAKAPFECLVEVNTSGQASKFGVEPQQALELIDQVSQLPNIKLVGLMTMGPYPVSEVESRKSFALLREIRDRAQRELGLCLPVLSMGMSEDYIWAVEEGATRLRLGRAVFGPRRR